MEPAGELVILLNFKICKMPLCERKIIYFIHIYVAVGPNSSDRICYGGSETRFCNCGTQIQNPRSPGGVKGTIRSLFYKELFLFRNKYRWLCACAESPI